MRLFIIMINLFSVVFAYWFYNSIEKILFIYGYDLEDIWPVMLFLTIGLGGSIFFLFK